MPLRTLPLPIFSVLYGSWIFPSAWIHASSSIGFYWILRFIPCFQQRIEVD
ncbi:hypothetical protein PSPO01_03610 [Paraphaeosphaeria sporulosa]